VKVLVTGANGFVGRTVVKRLVDEGHSVIAAVGPGASIRPADQNVQMISLDVANDVSLRASVTQPLDAVIHLAAVALSRAADRDPELAWKVNAEGTAKLAATLANAAARWGTQPSSCLRPQRMYMGGRRSLLRKGTASSRRRPTGGASWAPSWRWSRWGGRRR